MQIPERNYGLESPSFQMKSYVKNFQILSLQRCDLQSKSQPQIFGVKSEVNKSLVTS